MKAALAKDTQKLTNPRWWGWVDLNHRPRPYQSSAIRFYNNLKTAGTAKIRGSRTRHRMLWVGLWVEKSPRFCGNPHSDFQEIRSSVRIILRRRFGKPPSPLHLIARAVLTNRSPSECFSLFRVV